MKLSLKQLKTYINEAILGNVVPDFVLVQAIDDMVKVVRQNLMKFILMQKSQDPNTKATATQAMEEMIEGFRGDVKEAFEIRLEEFKGKM
jgi:hypothetical protein